MADNAVGRHYGLQKFKGTARREKVEGILSLTGVSCIVLGLGWTLCYLYFGRAELSIVFVGLIGVGVLALLRSKRSDGASLLIVAHCIFLAVYAIARPHCMGAAIGPSIHASFGGRCGLHL